MTLPLILAILIGTTAPADPCAGAPFHQFDFWIGDWNVYASGKLAGRDVVSRVAGSCSLQERWYGAAGDVGTSLNGYDSAYGVWRQFWIDNRGTVLRLEGTRNGTVMSMDGPQRDVRGAFRSRITWTANPDGTIRQVWTTSRDDWKHSRPVFDGLYRRVRVSP